MLFLDQNACTSPHTIIWKKTKNLKVIKKIFWNKVIKIAQKEYELNLSQAYKKYELITKIQLIIILTR